jgi:putative FmdB family regulatory protein
MPTYEYKCPEGHEFELFQRMSDEPVATCPECGERARRQFSTGGGFLFKGEGFYITDYRSKEYREKAKAEKGGGKEGASKDEGGSSKSGAASTSKGSEGSGGAGTSSSSSSD